jgi:hypothetical protein
LDEPQEFIIKKFLNSARNGKDAVINCVDSSTNQNLQEYYEHLRNVREILIKEQQQSSVQKKKKKKKNLTQFLQTCIITLKNKYNF